MNWDDVKALIEKYRNKAGLKGKIIAKCIDCSVDPADKGNWRQQVMACNCPACPLYEIRPISRPEPKREASND
jgi:hypothetical protein